MWLLYRQTAPSPAPLPRCRWTAPRRATASPTRPSRNSRSPSAPPTSNVWTASRRLSDGAAGRAAGADGAPPVHRPGFLRGRASTLRRFCPRRSWHGCPLTGPCFMPPAGSCKGPERPCGRPGSSLPPDEITAYLSDEEAASGTSAVCPLPSGIPAPGRARPAVRLSRQPRPG